MRCTRHGMLRARQQHPTPAQVAQPFLPDVGHQPHVARQAQVVVADRVPDVEPGLRAVGPQQLAAAEPGVDPDARLGQAEDASKLGGEHWVVDGTVSAQSRKVDYNDLGFMDRQNDLRAGLYAEYRTLRPTFGLIAVDDALHAHDLGNAAVGFPDVIRETCRQDTVCNGRDPAAVNERQ